MSRKKPNPPPVERDPWAVSAAAGYALTLLQKHGAEYPAFAEIAQRVQRESLRLDDLADHRMSAAAFGFGMETTLHNMKLAAAAREKDAHDDE